MFENLDVALLGKELDWATSEWRKARRGEQSEWMQHSWFCGSACCVAGKICLDAGWTKDIGDAYVTKNGVVSTASEVANAELGLEGGTHNLFSGDNLIWDLWRIAEQITNGVLRAPLDVDAAAFEHDLRYQGKCPCGCGMETPVN